MLISQKDHYHKALLIKPDNPKTIFKLAKQYFYEGEFNRACEYYLKAVQLAPLCHSYYSGIKGSLLFSRFFDQQVNPHDLESGINLLQQTTKEQSNFLFTQRLLADLLTHQGKTQEAISYYQAFSYQKTLASHPELTKQHWNSQQLRKPDFIVGGFSKCGTTSLHSYLTSHPQVLAATEKEIFFFSHFLDKGNDWYFAHFPAIQEQNYLTGEASSFYLFWANPKQILELLPKIKLICLIRNPVDRVISFFYQLQRIGHQQISLEESLSLSIKCLQDLSPTDILNLPNKVLKNYSIPEQLSLIHMLSGLYIYFVKEWLNIFPKEQFLILKSEDFYHNPATTMKQVHCFLDLPDYHLKEYRIYNPGSYSCVPEDLRCQLAEFFQPYNQQLEECLGRSLNWE
ncbi:MAG: sulfotransferase domain-containing protein [Spirulinaceae cyanobacterium]